MNLMLTATCNNTDEFYKTGYSAAKAEFGEWCDASRCVFAKVDDTNLIETLAQAKKTSDSASVSFNFRS